MAGRLTTSVTATLDYNYDGKLASATIGSDSISLKYDAMGNRVYKSSTVDSSTTNTRFILDIASKLPTILLEIDSDDGSLETSYAYANAQPLAMFDHYVASDPNYYDTYYYLHDRLGSVRQVIDENASVRNTYTYHPFGQDLVSDCNDIAVENPFKYTGQYYDAEIAQYYLRARMYDPQLMRFTNRDPVKGKFVEPLSLHRYLYCHNNSINYVDPEGRVLAYAAKIVIGGIVGGVTSGLSADDHVGRAVAVGAILGMFSAAIPGDLLGPIAGIILGGADSLHTSYTNGEDALQTGIRLITGIAGGATSGVIFGSFGGDGLTTFIGSGVSAYLAGYIFGGTSDGASGLIGGYADEIYDVIDEVD